jgi:sRNA-binding carbon storage regulator CsrA
VKVGIDAPLKVPVHRQEVYDEIQRANREALTQPRARLPRLSDKSNPAALKVPAPAKLN